MCKEVIKKATIEEATVLYRDFLIPNFPGAELKPMELISRMMDSGLYQVLYLESNGKPVCVAFLTAYSNDGMYLLDYLAVDEKVRSCGYGGMMLRRCIHETNGRAILIETEPLETAENDEQTMIRKKRNAFYIANGAVMTGVKTRIFGIEFDIWILTEQKIPARDVILEELTYIYRFMVKEPEVYEKNVDIPS